MDYIGNLLNKEFAATTIMKRSSFPMQISQPERALLLFVPAICKWNSVTILDGSHQFILKSILFLAASITELANVITRENDCYAYSTNVRACETLKTYYQREQFARYIAEGKSSHMFSKDGNKKPGSNYQSSSKNAVKTVGSFGFQSLWQRACMEAYVFFRGY